MYPFDIEASTEYLNPKVNFRKQGEFTGKYIVQDQYGGVFTIPGEQISNLHQHSRIYLSAHVDEYKYK